MLEFLQKKFNFQKLLKKRIPIGNKTGILEISYSWSGSIGNQITHPLWFTGSKMLKIRIRLYVE